MVQNIQNWSWETGIQIQPLWCLCCEYNYDQEATYSTIPCGRFDKYPRGQQSEWSFFVEPMSKWNTLVVQSTTTLLWNFIYLKKGSSKLTWLITWPQWSMIFHQVQTRWYSAKPCSRGFVCRGYHWWFRHATSCQIPWFCCEWTVCLQSSSSIYWTHNCRVVHTRKKYQS